MDAHLEKWDIYAVPHHKLKVMGALQFRYEPFIIMSSEIEIGDVRTGRLRDVMNLCELCKPISPKTRHRDPPQRLRRILFYTPPLILAVCTAPSHCSW